MKLTHEECLAMAEAYESAAGHLELMWTDDPVERQQGDALSKRFHAQAKRYLRIAAKLPESAK